MSKSKPSQIEALSSRLRRLLSSANGPTQEALAAKCGCDQAFVSRVANNEICRETRRTKVLRQVVDIEYANMRNKTAEPPVSVSSAVLDYLAEGGSPDLLVQQLELLSAAYGRRTAFRRHRAK